ncbi:uncharacterized protein N7518_008820 [Penicillium psychrosexuale]|uniref:uncharacterized protein n=1 Tax=Penicillium psychrosexuale TaxID=1002107 RepID=UPI0025458E1A|nr:uncharacterized protein N7518_008820 [Penicillium psychrosexuale]KAJ5791809.1 hypothetical protein N7518_008820 [Penicillium psychrosexuale]
MKLYFLLESLDVGSGFPNEGRTHSLSRHESSRQWDTIYIPSDDSVTPTVFMDLYSSPKRQTKDTIPHISGDAEIKIFKSQHTRRQPQKPLTGSTRRAPLQQNLKVFQAGATTLDKPGTGGGKENIPPGFSVITNKKSKSENHSPVSKMARPAVQNATLRTRITTKPNEAQIEPMKRVTMSETRGNAVRVPKKIEHSPPTETPRPLPLKHVFSAIVIQRKWRSFTERRNKRACAIATVRMELAYEVITRWWRGVKACRLREQTEQVKLMERTEQTPRRKRASQRSSVRQSQHNSGRRGIRRL